MGSCMRGLPFVAWMKPESHLMDTIKALAKCLVCLCSSFSYLVELHMLLVIIWALSFTLTLNMWAVNDLVWLHMCMLVWAFNNWLYSNQPRVSCLFWRSDRMLKLRCPKINVTELLFCVLEQDSLTNLLSTGKHPRKHQNMRDICFVNSNKHC